MGLEKLMQNPYAWAVLSLCTVISVLFAIWAYGKGKRKLEISYYSTTNEIVRDGKYLIPDLIVLYRDEAINNLTATRYAIWNSGTEVLNNSDIVASVPLQILNDDSTGNILDAIIIEQSEETNMFKVIEKTPQCIKINFDYANKMDGIVVQVLHTGAASSLKVDCKIKGGKAPKNVNNSFAESINKEKSRKANAIATAIAGIITVLILFGATFLYMLKDSPYIPKEILEMLLQEPSRDDYIMLFISIIVLAILVFFEAWIMIKSAFYIKIPPKLRGSFTEGENDPKSTKTVRSKVTAILHMKNHSSDV